MGKMLGFKALMVLPLAVAPMALTTSSVTLSTDTLIPASLVLLLFGAVWKAAREVEKLTSTLNRLVRRTDKLVGRADRIEHHLNLPADPDLADTEEA